jgi:hypothetical protein
MPVDRQIIQILFPKISKISKGLRGNTSVIQRLRDGTNPVFAVKSVGTDDVCHQVTV